MNMVIIGNGAGGLAALEAIRKHDQASSITVISKESQKPYSRVLLPYWLTRKTTWDNMFIRENDYFESLNAECLQAEAVKVDPKAKNVLLADGNNLPYDRLLIASGSSPVKPPIPGLEGNRVLHLWNLDDAARMDALFDKGGRALVIGSGFVALQAAWAAIKRGLDVSIVEIMQRILPTVLDDSAARLLADKIVDAGADLRVKTICEKVDHDPDGGLCAHLAGGESIKADLIIVGAGARPNIDFLKDSDLAVDRGVLVNDRMETNLEGVYAVGDAAQGPSFLDNEPVVYALWPTAVEMGAVAGANMAGQAVSYSGAFNMNVTQFFNVTVASMGDFMESVGDEVWLDHGLPEGQYFKIVLRNRTIRGAVAVGDSTLTATFGMLNPLIRGRVKLDRDPSFCKNIMARNLAEHYQLFAKRLSMCGK